MCHFYFSLIVSHLAACDVKKLNVIWQVYNIMMKKVVPNTFSCLYTKNLIAVDNEMVDIDNVCPLLDCLASL